MTSLYFAYGSNMDVIAMAARCPGARIVGPALLPRRRFAIMPEGYATIVPDAADAVHGLLWRATDADIRALDEYEEVDAGLYAKIVLPILSDAAPAASAIVYVGRGENGRPEPAYISGIIAAARAIGLDAAYVARLEALASR